MVSGRKRSDSLRWILSQIRDGNGVKSPRNLVDIMRFALEEQTRREQRNSRKYIDGVSMIEAEAIKSALVRLSKRRIEDTLMAEYGSDVQRTIQVFHNGKSDHNESSICKLFGIEPSKAREISKILMEIGFFEQDDDIYKIPALYRVGMNISKGKACQ